jgi:hypothetical protein
VPVRCVCVCGAGHLFRLGQGGHRSFRLGRSLSLVPLGVVAFTRRGVVGVASKACTCVLLFYELGSVSLFWASSLTAKKSGCWVLLCVH